MKKYLITALMFAVLTLNILAYDQYSGEELNHIDDELRKYFCRGVRNGVDCNIPEVFGDEIEGICCGGFCMEGIRECSQTPERGRWNSPSRILITNSCADRGDNEPCDLPRDLMDFLGFWKAVCCKGLCYSNIGDCRESRGDFQDYGPHENMNVDEMIKIMESLSCKGRGDGEKCNIPKSVVNEFNLSGVCCSGECMFGETECTGKPDLVVTEIKLMDDIVWVNKPVNYKIVMQNIGHARVNEYFWVEFSGGDTLETKYFYIAEKPAPGDYLEYRGSLEYSVPGKYILKATVDRHIDDSKNNLVAEEDEGNNALDQDVVVEKRWEDCNRNDRCEGQLGETYENCPCDCHPPDGEPVCGNGCCEEGYGETYESCPRDCMKDRGGWWVCGNNVCERDDGENQVNCIQDCHCGNNICEDE